MRLRARLQQLTRRMGLANGACPLCPTHATVRLYDVGGPEPPPLGPCRGCGRMPTGKAAVVVMVPRSAREGPANA
jgi:hypothetical protein